jgi:hypothetical protein
VSLLMRLILPHGLDRCQGKARYPLPGSALFVVCG